MTTLKRKLEVLSDDEDPETTELLLNPSDYYEANYVTVHHGTECRINGVQVVTVSVVPEVAAFLKPNTVKLLMCSKELYFVNGEPKERFTWQPCIAERLVQRTPWLSTLLGRLLLVCDLGYLRNADGSFNSAKVKKSNVLHWLCKIRTNLYKFRAGVLENQDLSLHESTISANRLTSPPRDTTRMKGCKVQMHTFMKHRKSMNAFLANFHSVGAVFPMQNTVEVRESAKNAYAAVRYTSSAGNTESERELRFACLVHALCPHVFPQAQDQQGVQIDVIASACHKQYEEYQHGYLVELGVKFAGLRREHRSLATGANITRRSFAS